MRREEARVLLVKVNQFVGLDRDDPELEKKADRLFHAMEQARFQCKPDEGFVARKLQQHIKNYMESLCNRDETKIEMKGTMEICFGRNVLLNNKGKPAIITLLKDPIPSLSTGGTIDGILVVLNLLLFIADIRQVIKCKYCEKYIFSTNKKQKYCSDNADRCKNSFNNKNRSPEQVEAIRKRRVEKRKELEGGKK